MKKLFSILLLLCSINTYATHYFVSASGSDANNGTSTSTPFKTIAKVNSLPLVADDIVSFNGGDIFMGSLIPRSGTSGHPIIYNSYGTGNAIITGFVSVTSWNNLGSNIWESSSSVSTLGTCNMVTINGVNTAMGRFPNTGYLTYQSVNGLTQFTSSSLKSAITNWTGATAVIKKARYIIDRNPITAQSVGTGTYSGGASYSGISGFGFFIENDIRTLDQQNEWYYNPSKKIDIYYATSPTGVQVSGVDTLLLIVNKSYITINGINFTGANGEAMHLERASNITITNCNISFCQTGIMGVNVGSANSSTNLTLSNNTFDHINNNGIKLNSPTDFSNCTVSGNTLTNIALFEGMAGSGDGQFIGISMGNSRATGVSVHDNIVDSIGYDGILMQGSDGLCYNNFVNNSCLLKDDGAGIYTGGPHTNLRIYNNIVLNSMGTSAGTNAPGTLRGYGFYSDDNSTNETFTNNSSYNAGYAGFFLHNAKNITLYANTSYGAQYAQILISNYLVAATSLNIKQNIWCSVLSRQLCAEYKTAFDDFPKWGVMDSNYYARPVDDNLIINSVATSGTLRSLAGWQTYSGQDAHAHKSPKTITTTGDLDFEYNATGSPAGKTLPPGNWETVSAALYSGTITLAPYTSLVLNKHGN